MLFSHRPPERRLPRRRRLPPSSHPPFSPPQHPSPLQSPRIPRLGKHYGCLSLNQAQRVMNVFRVPLIAMLTMISLAAFAQPGIRVHRPLIASTSTAPMDGFSMMKLSNHKTERAQQTKIWREQRKIARRQQELDAERARADRDQTCACRKLNPGILVMQSAQGWATKNVPGAIDGARDRCI